MADATALAAAEASPPPTEEPVEAAAEADAVLVLPIGEGGGGADRPDVASAAVDAAALPCCNLRAEPAEDKCSGQGFLAYSCVSSTAEQSIATKQNAGSEQPGGPAII